MHINCSCFVARQLAMQMSFELHDRRFVVFPLFLFSFFAALSKIKLKYIFFAAEMHRLRTASVHWSIRPSVCPSVRFRLCLFSHTIDRQHNNNNNNISSQCPQNQCKCNERRINFAKCKTKNEKNRKHSIFMCVPNKQILICQLFRCPAHNLYDMWAVQTRWKL